MERRRPPRRPAQTHRAAGPQGEVSAADLSFAFGNTSANSNMVQTLDTTGFSDPPTLNDLLAVASKLNELINALRR